MTTSIDTHAVRAALLSRLDALGARLDQVEQDFAQPHDPDSGEQAIERESEEAEEAIGDAAVAEIAATRAAIARLDAGSYGLCVSCGDPIAPARLAALPAASQCIACARAAGS
ncbi:hypothetical protein GCM10009087_17550 [Sphingomonas oligophenolica]|uniref:TraR/DksA C4-type zinc finger protein n=1 Tax=Sphingomonas oligophenolica TaxID=301154 RepID=A0ABU9Y5R7_9SPHN